MVLGLVLTAGASASASRGLDCQLGSPHYNTGLCGISKKKAGEKCAEVAHVIGNPVIAGYVAGSTSSYRIKINEEDGLEGCDAAGLRTVSYFQEMRKGLSGVFVRSGKSTTRFTNRPFRVNETQTIPYDCSVDGPGTAVRTVARFVWHPHKGWGGTTTPHDHVSKPSTIC